MILERSQSCGCVQSRGEELLSRILSEMNISFVKEKKFKDCINPKTERSLRFDFYLPDYNICIEYDGIQHFQKTNYSHEDFEDRIIRDKIKDNFCKENQIRMIRFNKDDFNKITKDFLWEKINESKS